MTYQDVKNQMLQGSPEGELYQVVSDMIELCEGIGQSFIENGFTDLIKQQYPN